MSVPLYEVFAIRVGANAQRTARENFLYDACCGDPNAPMPLDYYFWVIRNEHQVIVVDTCFQPATADRRNRQMYRLPEDSLRQLDIDPAQVEHLILTHLHWDHAGNLGLFPKATVHLQEAELRFCTGPKMAHHTVNKTYEVEDVMSALPPLFEGRMRLHNGTVEVLLGVLQRLIDNGATVVVIEHDLDMIVNADYVIDLGPGGGEDGGRVVAAGTPEAVAACPESITGRYIAEEL